jgi:hypothetical protein
MAFIQFVRVRDKDTGHEYDVVESAIDPAAQEPVESYPPNLTGQARPPKHRINTKATTPAATTKEK